MRTQVARRKRTLLRTRTYGRGMAAWLPALAAPGPHPLTLEAGGPAQVRRRWMLLASGSDYDDNEPKPPSSSARLRSVAAEWARLGPVTI
jgi:hypothetical protein